MADAVKDAKLRLDLDTTKAVRGMEEVVRVGEKVERQLEKTEQAAEKATGAIGGGAAAAAKTFERFGADNLSKSEVRKARAEEKRREREMLAEVNREMEEDKKLRAELRKNRWKLELGRRSQLDDERRAAEQAKKQSLADQETKKKEYASFLEAFTNEQEVLERAARKKAAEDRLKAIKQTEAERTRHEAEVAAAERQSMANRLRGITAAAQLVGGGNPLALLGGAGMGGIAAGAIIQAGAHGIGAMASLRDDFLNRDLSTDDAFRRHYSRWTFGGSDVLRRWQYDHHGVTHANREAQILSQQEIVRTQAESHREQIHRANRAALVSAGNREAALHGAVAPHLGAFDVYSREGVQGLREAQIRLPAMDAILEAERNYRATRGDLGHAKRDEMQSRNRHATAVGMREMTEARVENERRHGSVESHQAALRDLHEWQTREREAQTQLQSAIERTRDVTASALTAQINLRRQHINAMQSELQILQQRQQLHANDLSRFGALNPIQRRQSLEGALAMRRNGFNNTTPEQRQNAAMGFPGFVNREAMRSAENDPLFQQARAAGLTEVDGNLGLQDMQNKARELQNSIRDAGLGVVVELERGFRLTLDEFAKKAIAALSASVDAAISELDRKRQMGAVQANHAQN